MRGRRRVAAMLAAAMMLAVVAPGASHAATPDQVGNIPSGAQKVMDKEPYATARWLYDVADLKTGEVLLANRPHELVFTGSTAKNFTIGSAYAILGPDFRTTTPVYSTSPAQDGVVTGNLVLVASGDLALGGRGALQDKFDQSFTATAIDHVYGDIAPNAVLPPGDPLAGLNSLAAQVASKGVTRVQGDVVVDDRLWQTETGHEGPVPPIFVNDNLLDLTVTPAAVGAVASVAASPTTSAYGVQSNVMTEAGSDVKLTVTADPADPQLLLVSGTIGADAGPRLTIYRVPDPASWARTLFIEALGRAGVTVAADPARPNATTNLPAPGGYDNQLQLASLTSPPLSAIGTMILETSYNTGANTVLCLLAVHQGSTSCVDGLKAIRGLIDQAGLASSNVVLTDGEGAYPASVTPEQMVRWLTWTQSQPWGATFKAGQPVLGQTGTLAGAGLDSPARGKVLAKTGTVAAGDPATGRALFNVQSMGGFMQTNDGRWLVFDVSMSGGTYPNPLAGLVQATDDVGEVTAQFQQALSH
ncbi:MAG: D-alanyl-D-alanine carboxypeptidase/D-alanyl-D-alanine-endopeptidase [Chloroflexi bacterium]|nr:D-alanyl-D-alanine carboxypeptidase/D-alanyl-D-alanine-endopeptidase [Chloroflexota bacterium]